MILQNNCINQIRYNLYTQQLTWPGVASPWELGGARATLTTLKSKEAPAITSTLRNSHKTDGNETRFHSLHLFTLKQFMILSFAFIGSQMICPPASLGPIIRVAHHVN